MIYLFSYINVILMSYNIKIYFRCNKLKTHTFIIEDNDYILNIIFYLAKTFKCIQKCSIIGRTCMVAFFIYILSLFHEIPNIFVLSLYFLKL